MITLKANAKINWFLKILGRRHDGYHEVQSLMQKVSLHDTLMITPSSDLTLDADGGISERDNLVFRAATLLKGRYSVQHGAHMELEKKIPIGAGLGGGSSDAAAALYGLNKLWSLNLSTDTLSDIGAELGSDVPFFLHGPVSFVYGRGEKLSPCNAGKKLYILLVKPAFAVSTAWAYKNLTSPSRGENGGISARGAGEYSIESPKLTKKTEKDNNIKLLIRNIEEAQFSAISGSELNDLESVVIREFHVIAEIKERLKDHGAVFSMMSGSGSTVFGVFRSRDEAESASVHFQGFWTEVVHTVTD